MPRLAASLLVLLLGCAGRTPPPWRYPAEWEPHAALWIGFRSLEVGGHFDPAVIPAVRVLAAYVPLKLVVETEEQAAEARAALTKAEVELANIEIVVQNPTDFWFRDPGPMFLVGRDGRMRIADFKYSNYGNMMPDKWTEKARAYEKIDRDIAKRLGLTTVASRVVMEGGAFEVNGAGTVVLVESLMLGRNPHLTRREIEREVITTLGQRKVVWVERGPADDPDNFARIHEDLVGLGTGGHSDEFIRFADARTILLSWVDEEDAGADPVALMNRERLLDADRRLRAATDQDGRPFRIVHVPHPGLEYEEKVLDDATATFLREKFSSDVQTGEKVRWVAVSSYLNYVVTNGVVLVPRYWREGRSERLREKDEEVQRIIAEAFPGRRIVPLDVLLLNFGAGGLHCITQQQPAL